MCVASFNPKYQRGLKQLKPSTRQRFVTIEFNYPEQDKEIEIISKITGIDKALAKKLVKFANHVRGQSELGLQETVSTRLLIHGARMIQADVPIRRACELTIAQCLTDDTQTSQALIDLIAINF